jgi:hypothetical protein
LFPTEETNLEYLLIYLFSVFARRSTENEFYVIRSENTITIKRPLGLDIQIICSKVKNGQEIISNFDISACCLFISDNIYCSVECMKTLITNKIIIKATNTSDRYISRLLKYKNVKGFDLEKSLSILENNPSLQYDYGRVDNINRYYEKINRRKETAAWGKSTQINLENIYLFGLIHKNVDIQDDYHDMIYHDSLDFVSNSYYSVDSDTGSDSDHN